MFSTSTTSRPDPPAVEPHRTESVQDVEAEIEEVEARLSDLKEKRDRAGREATRKWRRVREARAGSPDRLSEIEREAQKAEKRVTEIEGHIHDLEERREALRAARAEKLEEEAAATEEEVRQYFEAATARLRGLLEEVKREAVPLFEDLKETSRQLRRHNQRARKTEETERIGVERPPLPKTMGEWRRFIRQWEEKLEDTPYG